MAVTPTWEIERETHGRAELRLLGEPSVYRITLDVPRPILPAVQTFLDLVAANHPKEPPGGPALDWALEHSLAINITGMQHVMTAAPSFFYNVTRVVVRIFVEVT